MPGVLFIRTARLILGAFGIEALYMVELIFGLFLWLVAGRDTARMRANVR
jgi:hypothetical protein